MKKSNISEEELKELLDELYDRYNNIEFIEEDPVSIPHMFEKKEDIEISGFLTSVISWGKRTLILKSARNLMQLMDFAPYDFILNAGKDDLKILSSFYYRTFQSVDILFFVKVLREIYRKDDGLENIFTNPFVETGHLKKGLQKLYSVFLSVEHQERSMKHIANVSKGSSAKRINMFLRWMVRKDERGVDFGLWKQIMPSALFLPLDVHSGRVARDLYLLKRKQNDWKAVEEVTNKLKTFDSEDPVKYDFALFGAGINGVI